MNLSQIPPGIDPPRDIHVIIEIPGGADGGSPVKYEIDKESGAIQVDRILQTSMFYPCNYGFVPHTLAPDGDPLDVLVRTQFSLIPGSVIRCRPIALLEMEDEAGLDGKILAVPVESVDPFQKNITSLADVSITEQKRIQHFFETYKDLEEDKWSRVIGWRGSNEARKLILDTMQAGS